LTSCELSQPRQINPGDPGYCPGRVWLAGHPGHTRDTPGTTGMTHNVPGHLEATARHDFETWKQLPGMILKRLEFEISVADVDEFRQRGFLVLYYSTPSTIANSSKLIDRVIQCTCTLLATYE
jgi:hypothetical protein